MNVNELKQLAQNIIDDIKKRGIDKAFCSVSSAVKTEFNVDNGSFSLMRTLFESSLSITVYNEGKKGFVNINKIDSDSISGAIDECIKMSESATPDDAWEVAPVSVNQDFVEGSPDIETDKLFDRTAELVSYAEEKYPKVILQQVIVTHVKVEKAYANSNGVLYSVLAGDYSGELMFSALDGEKTSSFYGSGFTVDNLDTPFYRLGTVEKDFSDIEKQIETVPVDGKFVGTVLFVPASFAEAVETILSDFCGDMAILDGTSIWKNKLGQKVVDERITVSLNPSDHRIVCGEKYTSEGYLSEDLDIIKDGVLKNFAISSYVANKTGNKRATASSGLIVKPGNQSLDDIIRGIDRGIIIGRFSGGQPASNGDFSGVAKNSFYVENGKIKYAVSETMINGNFADMFNNLRAVSSDVVCDGDVALPYVAFDGLTISGK